MALKNTGAVRHVAVIGGGIVGTLSAWALLRAGLRVTLIERELFGRGCSSGNAGSVSAGSVVPLGMPGMWKQVPGWMIDPDGPLHIRTDHALQVLPWLVRFLKASTPERVEAISHALKALTAPSIEIYREVIHQIDAPTLFEASGQLQVYSSEKAMQKDAGGWALRRARGVSAEEVSGREIHELEPSVGPQFTHGIYLPNEGMIVNPSRLVRRLAESFVAAGGVVKEWNVKGLDARPDRSIRILCDGGVVEPDSIVIAAGVWSQSLAAQLGDSLPLESQRGYHVSFPQSGIQIKRTVVASEAKCFATPMEDGLRVAGTVEFGSPDAPASRRRVEALLHHSKALFPALSTAKYSDWMGNRPCMPDSLPVLGHATEFPSVIYAFGHGHLGITCAPMTSRVVTDLIQGKVPAIDLTPYSPARF
ncbi:MAG: FAD-dependent oxidoreductase [Pseudomonadota bacterium]